MENRKIGAIEKEIAGEKAAAFGRTATALEAALGALRRFDGAAASGADAAARRHALVGAAAERLLHVLVHREACGLRDPDYVYRCYDVPRDVIARLGARR